MVLPVRKMCNPTADLSNADTVKYEDVYLAVISSFATASNSKVRSFHSFAEATHQPHFADSFIFCKIKPMFLHFQQSTIAILQSVPLNGVKRMSRKMFFREMYENYIRYLFS